MRNWIYPTIIFVLFLYVMAFVLFYTYRGHSSYGDTKTYGNVPTTSVEDFQAEINKRIK